MKNAKEFIEKVTKKLGYTKEQYTVIEDTGVYEEVKEDVLNALYAGIVFIEGACVPKSVVNQVVKELDSITWGNGNGVSIVVSDSNKFLNLEDGINIKSLAVINAFLNEFMKVAVGKVEEKDEPKERISLKDYYRLCLPENKIGRKSDNTLIKELEEAEFKI